MRSRPDRAIRGGYFAPHDSFVKRQANILPQPTNSFMTPKQGGAPFGMPNRQAGAGSAAAVSVGGHHRGCEAVCSWVLSYRVWSDGTWASAGESFVVGDDAGEAS